MNTVQTESRRVSSLTVCKISVDCVWDDSQDLEDKGRNSDYVSILQHFTKQFFNMLIHLVYRVVIILLIYVVQI